MGGRGGEALLLQLGNFLQDEVLVRRLVAVYLIDCPGVKIDLSEFPHLRLSSCDFDTGCIVFFNVNSGKDLRILEENIRVRTGAFWK